MMKHIAGIFVATMILVLTGCASAPMAPVTQDNNAKEFLTTPNKASLYIYRNEVIGGAVSMDVTLNGKALGQTAAQTYFWLNVLPGKYDVGSRAENVSTLSLTMEAGKNYFVWQEVKMGFLFARNLLQEVDEATGRAGVMESKLIASSVSDNDLKPLDMPVSMPSPVQSPSNSSASQSATYKKLKELDALRKDGVLTQEEFDLKKAEILKGM